MIPLGSSSSPRSSFPGMPRCTRSTVDLHQVVPDQRERRAVHLRRRRAAASRALVLHPHRPQRLVPWSLLLPCAAVAEWKPHAQRNLLWFWIIAIVGFFSLSGGIRICISSDRVGRGPRGRPDERGCRTRGGRRGLCATLTVGGALLALAGGRGPYLFETAGRVYALDAALTSGRSAWPGRRLALLASARKPAPPRCRSSPR